MRRSGAKPLGTVAHRLSNGEVTIQDAVDVFLGRHGDVIPQRSLHHDLLVWLVKVAGSVSGPRSHSSNVGKYERNAESLGSALVVPWIAYAVE